MRTTTAQVVKADVRNNAINPGEKRALEAKTVQIPINLKKCFLVYILSILGAAEDIKGQPEDLPIIALYKYLKGRAIARLCAFDQETVVRDSESQLGSGRDCLADRVSRTTHFA